MSVLKIIKHWFSRSNKDDYAFKYRIQKKRSSLGSGGNGDVRKAICIETDELVALKCLNKEAKNNKEKQLRFEDEIITMLQAGKKINGIIPILDYSIKGCWYVMPVAESINGHCANIKEIVCGILQIAETLVELHNMGLSHRDIKPDNMLYYDGRWVLCDFGLVDIPDNPHNLTKNSNRVGAIKTIAPEMSRNAKTADGTKADVYSLAKSLWMLLTNNNDSFEGHYEVTDDSVSLHQYSSLREEHLIEIDELLIAATENDPTIRPTMKQFVEKLKSWQDVSADFSKQQISNWDFLKEYLFHDNGPESCTWKDPVKIKKVLDLLTLLPLYSHIFFPDKGWVRFKKIEIGSEPPSLDLYTSMGIYRVRLGELHFESFQHSFWNYFLLDAEPVEPVVGAEVDEFTERVVEDRPGHFVSAVDAIYGVYSYDGGEKLPKGSKVLIRCLKGKLLIVLKQGPYNHITQTDDGRHNNCSVEEFRKYIEDLQNLYVLHGLVTDEMWKHLFHKLVDGCTFRPDALLPAAGKMDIKSDPNFVKDNWQTFDFSAVLGAHPNMPVGKAKYRFKFNMVNGGGFLDMLVNRTGYYLCKDGFVRVLNHGSDEIYEATDRETAIIIFKGLEDVIGKYCEGKVMEFDKPYFTVKILKVSNPQHIFTVDEIKSLMTDADDRINNTLVIDEEGYARIITDQSLVKFYPVINEVWCERLNYVGKYSDLSELEPTYHYSLGKWRDYLKNGVGQIMDDYDDYYESDEELLQSIESYSR